MLLALTMKRLIFVALMAVFFSACARSPKHETTVADTSLTAADHSSLTHTLDSIARSILPAKFSLGYHLIETADTFSYNGYEKMSMQSTVKFPLALVVMQEIESGRLSLDTLISISQEEMNESNHGTFREKYQGKPTKVSVREMLWFMMVESDNITCGKFTRMIGGADELSRRIHAMGMKSFRIIPRRDRPTIDFDPSRNLCAPMEMTELVVKFYTARILTRSMTDTLRSIMEHANRPERITGALPEGIVIAHKTGTGGSTDTITIVNDVCVITLPSGKHLALAVYLRGAYGDMSAGEAITARIAKAAYDAAIKGK
jgi:beta-lactamase class A